MKMEWIIAAVLAVGCFFGGWFTRDLTKPTTVINNIDQTSIQTTHNRTEQQTMQGQVTMIVTASGTNYYYNVNLNGYTNITVTSQTNHTNYSGTN